jgi:hypothetical protein
MGSSWSRSWLASTSLTFFAEALTASLCVQWPGWGLWSSGLAVFMAKALVWS